MNSSMKDTFVKNSLGKLYIHIIFILLSTATLQAQDFTYKFNLSKDDPYVKEPVILQLDLNQTNHDVVMLFNFNIKQSKAYTFQRVDTQETDSYHNAKVRYIYLLYPLQSGDINISFEFVQKKTTDESVAYSFSGDRDNVKGLVTKNTKIDLPELPLHVKPLPDNTVLVGDFTLTHTIKKQKAKPYEPLPMQIKIKGTGYPPLLDALLPKEGNFTRFTEKPIVQSFASAKGTQSTVTYPMALSHTQSFRLPAVKLQAFDPKRERTYALEIPQQEFEIEAVDKETLVDKVDAPDVLKTDWSWLRTLLSYIIVFFAGYLSAYSWKWKRKQSQKEQHPLIQKINACKDEKALLQVLMATDNKRFTSVIEKIENALYNNDKISLTKLKKEAEEQL